MSYSVQLFECSRHGNPWELSFIFYLSEFRVTLDCLWLQSFLYIKEQINAAFLYTVHG